MKMATTFLAALGLIMLVQGCAGKNPNPRLVSLADGTCQDTTTGQAWRIKRSPTPVASLEEARGYIARLNQEGNNKDWRLPTAAELYDLNALFDLHLNGGCLMNREGRYWSSEKDGEGMVGTWEFGDTCDPQRQYFKGAGSGYVRAVRP